MLVDDQGAKFVMMLLPAIQPASRLLGFQRLDASQAWQLSELAGNIIELSSEGASATLTVAMRLVWEAQSLGEPVGWVAGRQSSFYPPDALENGVDLDALAVVRVPEARDIGKAADYLVRSGAFGLVVLDLGEETKLVERQLTRLLGLARKHGTAVVCLTHKPEASQSLGSSVSLRGPIYRERLRSGVFSCELCVTKDKRRPPGWRHAEVCRGPAGLR